jgi:hypothetical protein
MGTLNLRVSVIVMVIGTVLMIFVNACASLSVSFPTPTPSLPAKVSGLTGASPTFEPTPASTAIPATPVPTLAPTLDVRPPTFTPTATSAVSSFAQIPGNLAKGEPAPDFSARVLGGVTFTLSKQRGSPVLLFPTVVGCSECLATLAELGKVYPTYRGRGVKIVILDLYPGDAPDVWKEFGDYLPGPETLWSVVNSPEFGVNYRLDRLDTVLLVDRTGKLVFRNEHPLLADDFRQLFDLATKMNP